MNISNFHLFDRFSPKKSLTYDDFVKINKALNPETLNDPVGHVLNTYSAILMLEKYVEEYLLPENILSKLLERNFSYEISKFQCLSKEFIVNNLSKLYIQELLMFNINIPEETKTYIRMFI